MPGQVSDFLEILFRIINLIRRELWKNSIRENDDEQIKARLSILKVNNQKQKCNL